MERQCPWTNIVVLHARNNPLSGRSHVTVVKTKRRRRAQPTTWHAAGAGRLLYFPNAEAAADVPEAQGQLQSEPLFNWLRTDLRDLTQDEAV
jgi:hypothetical protein